MNSDGLGKGMKALSVILGALIGGFIWRCRGESGFGSSWGLYSVGLVLILLIYNFYGSRKGMKYELIQFGAFMTGLGVTGYATVIHQTAGFIYSDLPYQGQVVHAPVDPYSGLIIVLIMGFTLVPLYAFFVGTLFSKKEYKYYHYLIVIAIFFIVQTICKASVAHYILKLINPEQVNYALLGLKDSGYDYTSPMQAYMDHFLSRRWSQTVPFFENYYMSVEHVSDLIATIAVALYPLIAFKDRVTSLVTVIINAFTSIATTAFTSLMTVMFDTGFLANVPVPRSLRDGSGWGLWEYATGASVGFITMLVIALLPKELTAKGEIDTEPIFKNKKLSCAVNIIITIFIFGVVPWRAIGIRFAKLLAYEGFLKDYNPTGDILMIAGSIVFGIFFIWFIRKNIIVKNTTPLGADPVRFARIALPAYMGMCCVLYFFTNRAPIFHLPYSEMKSVSSFFYVMTSAQSIEFSLMFITFIAFLAIYIPVRGRLCPTECDKA